MSQQYPVPSQHSVAQLHDTSSCKQSTFNDEKGTPKSAGRGEHNASSMSAKRFVELISNVCRKNKFFISAGTVPDNSLLFKYNSSILLIFPISVGTLPFILLLDRSSRFRFVMEPITVGKLSRKLSSKSIDSIFDNCPNVCGISPVKPFVDNFIVVRFVAPDPSDDGTLPSKILSVASSRTRSDIPAKNSSGNCPKILLCCICISFNLEPGPKSSGNASRLLFDNQRYSRDGTFPSFPTLPNN
mmetsp:Transcript_35407/g.85688  ORF Transcript_35407/g.85688 Transcript_35407/m.85688 type:complete len:243 (-) Transcript_35407:969-1697(-)